MKKTGLIVLYVLVALGLAGFIVNKKPSISSQDKVYIDSFLQQWQITQTSEQVHQSLATELSFIQRLEHLVVHDIHHQLISSTHFGDVKYYYQQRVGFCYDRAVLLEKLFMYYHFDFRHVFVYYKDSAGAADPGFMDFFKKSTGSHALTEIRTQKGWMVIDSNSDCFGLTSAGTLYTIKDLKREIDRQGCVNLKEQYTCGTPFWVEHPHFKYLYGFYSRSGSFFAPHLGLPNVNIKMLCYNL